MAPRTSRAFFHLASINIRLKRFRDRFYSTQVWLTTHPFGDIAPVTQNGRALNFAYTPSIDAQKFSDRQKGFSRKHALRILEGAQGRESSKRFRNDNMSVKQDSTER